MTLPFQDARALADDARARALELGKALSIAVVDYGGFVVLIERMDGARPATPDIALSKAYSAMSRVGQSPVRDAAITGCSRHNEHGQRRDGTDDH